MTSAQERRSPSAHRVPLETLVEICGNEPGIPAFEAEALDVSAQGMHLRTAYLPVEGAPLVCRFEDHGREIVVEGVVAWRKESAKGGDFGVAFTALDKRSVEALRDLVKTGDPVDAPKGTDAPNGSRVRLHIEGLGSPMKARVRGGTTRKVQVGSSLEFLKVGRKLEVEDVEAGGRRGAQIDGVEVVVDPRTSIPQLVVALRYEGATEDTPEPTVTDLGAEPLRAQRLRLPAEAVTVAPEPVATDAGDPTPSGDVPEAKSEAGEDAADDEDEFDAAVPATTRAARQLGQVAENAGSVARDASVAAARWSASAFGKLAARLKTLRAADATPPKRRTTARPVDAPSALDGKRLRPQSAKSSEPAPAATPRRSRKPSTKVVAGAAVIAVAVCAGAIALRPSKPGKAGTAVQATGTALNAAASPTALATPSVTALATGVVPLPGAAPTAGVPLGTAAAALPSAPPPGSPVTANVPLFGPTPLATMEPAPLGPPPNSEAKSVEQAELDAAKSLAPAAANDEEFADPIEHVDSSKHKAETKSGDAKSVRPEDVPAWGKGRMHEPIIHRLRLDGPGAAIHGVADATGFTVVVPGRKLMEKATELVKRDSRINHARTTNTAAGAQIHLGFRNTLPGYRVRLRRDYLEILISSPEQSATKSIPASKTRDQKPAAKTSSKASSAKSTKH